jgi:hypothetical protein
MKEQLHASVFVESDFIDEFIENFAGYPTRGGKHYS